MARGEVALLSYLLIFGVVGLTAASLQLTESAVTGAAVSFQGAQCPAGSDYYSGTYGTPCTGAGSCWTQTCRTDFADARQWNWPGWWVQCLSGTPQLQGSTCGAGASVPTCSVNPSSVSVVSGSVSFSWSTTGDADGLVRYSCNGNLGSGHLPTASGSITVSPSGTQTCYIYSESSGISTMCSVYLYVIQPAVQVPSCSVSPSTVTATAGTPASFDVTYANDADGWIDYRCLNLDTGLGAGSGALPIPESLGGRGNAAVAGSGTYNEKIVLNTAGIYQCSLQATNSAGSSPCDVYFRVQSAQTCTDGTPYNSCSATKPKYCSSGTLIDAAGTCGCPAGQVASGNSCAIPTPTVDIKATGQDILTVSSGTTVNISWAATNVNNCTASGNWTGMLLATSGNEIRGSFFPVVISSSIFTLTCRGAGGMASDSVTVNVPAATAICGNGVCEAGESTSCLQDCGVKPTVDIKANGQDGTVTVNKNAKVELVWSSSNAVSCEIITSNPWAGVGTIRAAGVRGNVTVYPTSSGIVGLACRNSLAASAADSVSIIVAPPTCSSVLSCINAILRP